MATTAWLIVSVTLLLAAVFAFMAMLLSMRKTRLATQKHEAEMHFRDELFNTLANNYNDIYLVISADGEVVEYVSPNVETILGVSPEEVKSNLYGFQPPTYFDGVKPTRDELLAIPLGAMTQRDSNRVHKLTGETIYFRETTFHLMIDNIERMVAVLSDRTTERNQRVALEEALASAKSANKAKSTFLANVSHDIRTPMNAIVGLGDLLDEHADNPEMVKAYTGKIQDSSHHLLDLLNDVLDMSKIESGETILKSEPFKMASLLEELEKVVGPQAEAKGQEILFNVEKNVPEDLVGDRLRITQILMNILANAVKYTPENGAVSIDISVTRTLKTKSGVAGIRFVIADNGIGMSEDFLEHIFEPFSRETQSMVNGVQGTGLGMPIAKSLVDLMGGNINVESREGVGSRFTIDLGLGINQDVVVPEKRYEAIDISGMHFLIAEDVDINAEVLKALLETQGATCDIAVNGQDAHDAFFDKPQGTYDAILMDVQMPVMNGYDATRLIRSNEREDSKTIPIIAMTANAFLEDVNNVMASGMNAHLAKPASIKQIKETLGQVLKKA